MTYDFTEYSKVSVLGNNGCMTLNNLRDFLKKFHDTLIIYTGDFPLDTTFDNDIYKLESLEYVLSANNNMLLLIRGNKDICHYFKAKSSFKKELYDIADNVMLIPDYTVIQTKNHNILCIGGGTTLNRSGRCVNDAKSENVAKCKDLQKITDIDIVVSHIAPIMAYPCELTKNKKHFNSPVVEAYAMYDKHLKTDIYKGRLILKDVYETLSENMHIKQWIYGHYNRSNTSVYNNTEFISLKINEIKKI